MACEDHVTGGPHREYRILLYFLMSSLSHICLMAGLWSLKENPIHSLTTGQVTLTRADGSNTSISVHSARYQVQLGLSKEEQPFQR